MTELADLTAFQNVPGTFIIFDKDGVCGWVCSRCSKTGTWNGSIEGLVHFSNQQHGNCEIKADLEEAKVK